MVEGKHYRTERDFIEGGIEIKSDEIAIPSTIERLNMPCHLVGKPGIRFDYASQGLTGQMGIQVDPFFGKGHDNERLYTRVANLGNKPVPIPAVADVFMFELHEVKEDSPTTHRPKILFGTAFKKYSGTKTILAGAT